MIITCYIYKPILKNTFLIIVHKTLSTYCPFSSITFNLNLDILNHAY